MFTQALTDFPKDDRYWMVTWIYEVTLTENDYHLTVDLLAIEYSSKHIGPKPSFGNYTDEHRILRVSYALLPVLEIGSIWRNQHLFFTPAQTGDFLQITIPEPHKSVNISLQTLAQRLGGMNRFHATESLASSWCQVLETDQFTIREGERINLLIFPPSELLRFYYCGSDGLLKQILANGIPSDDVFIHEATRYEPDTQELFIRMRGHLRDLDALYVGRLAGDRTARRVAVQLGTRIQYELTEHQASQLSTAFPFDGPTKLSVTGRWIKMSKGWAYLVYSIISCAAELPFRKLYFYRENDSSQIGNPAEEKKASAGRLPEPSTPSSDALLSSTIAPSPGYSRSQLDMLTPASEKFLEAPTVERLKKEKQLTSSKGQLPRWYVELPSLTVANGSISVTEEPVGGVGTSEAELPPPQGDGVSYAEFHSITESLREQEITCLYFTIDIDTGELSISEDYKDSFYPHQPTAGDSIKRWLRFQMKREGGGSSGPNRRVVILQMSYEENIFFLFECQSRKKEHFSRFLILPEQASYSARTFLDAVLCELATKRGAWSNVELSALEVRKQSIYHRKLDSAADISLRIKRYMKKLLNFPSKTESVQ